MRAKEYIILDYRMNCKFMFWISIGMVEEIKQNAYTN